MKFINFTYKRANQLGKLGSKHRAAASQKTDTTENYQTIYGQVEQSTSYDMIRRKRIGKVQTNCERQIEKHE